MQLQFQHHGLPEIGYGMRVEWRVREIEAEDLTTCRSHSQCLVAHDGTEIATLAKDAVDEVLGEIESLNNYEPMSRSGTRRRANK